MANEATTETGNDTSETEQTPENKTTETQSTDAPKTESNTEVKTKPTTEQKTADVAELQKWITTFGAENGAKWFVEAECSYTTALERHAVLMTEQRDKAREEQQTTNELLTQVSEKLGELDPLNLESKETKNEEAGSQESGKGRTIQEILTARNKPS